MNTIRKGTGQSGAVTASFFGVHSALSVYTLTKYCTLFFKLFVYHFYHYFYASSITDSTYEKEFRRNVFFKTSYSSCNNCFCFAINAYIRNAHLRYAAKYVRVLVHNYERCFLWLPLCLRSILLS